MSPSPTKHTMDTSIFGLRFKSNESLQPGAADLAIFLRSKRLPGRTETHQDELAVFAGSLERVAAYEQGLVHGLVRVDSSERMLLGVLSHTRFFRPALRIAIEEYTYHLHQLLQLDFIKPEKFVRSAEEEVNRLNSKKKDDQQKIVRLQTLIEQRKRDLEALSKQRQMLTSELCHIAAYVRDNIVRIQQLCEDAIATLRDLKVGGKKTEQLIEDLKAHFKDEVRERRQMGAITTEYLESVKAEVAQLSQRLTQLVLGDVHIVRGIYEGFAEHAKKHAALLTELIGGAEQAKKADAGRDNESFAQIERALVALISEFRANVQAPAPRGAEARHEDLLQDKRQEMLDHVFALLMEQRKAGARTI